MKVMSLSLLILLLPLSSPAAQDLPFPHISGWTPRGKVETFTPKTLYEYINGAADLYLACDFEELRVIEYVNDRKASIVVEAYRHRTARDAFGIYSQERLPDGGFLAIGAQGYAGKDFLNFVQGPYYIKLSSAGAEDGPILQSVAMEVSDTLGQDKALPPLLSIFPAEGKKPHSEKYLTRNFLGYPFFSSAYTADYELAGRTFKLFVMEAADAAQCRDSVEKYLRQTRQPQRAAAEGRHTVQDPHHGIVDLIWKGSTIWGVLDLPDAELRSKVLASLERSLKPAR